MLHPGQEVYESVQREGLVTLHRCKDCWQAKRYPHPDGGSYADNNGFYPSDRSYPHATWCKNRAGF